MTKKLTDAQFDNLTTIKDVGGTVERDRYGFHKPGNCTPIRGMNAVAVRSLIKLGYLVEVELSDRAVISVAPPRERSPSEIAAFKWARERWSSKRER